MNNSKINQNISNPTQVTNQVNSISNAATTSGNNEDTVIILTKQKSKNYHLAKILIYILV